MGITLPKLAMNFGDLIHRLYNRKNTPYAVKAWALDRSISALPYRHQRGPSMPSIAPELAREA